MSKHLDGTPKSCDLCCAEATPDNPVSVTDDGIAYCADWSACGVRIDEQLATDPLAVAAAAARSSR